MEKIKTLIDEETINKRLNELATQISNDYKDKKPVIICILKGAVYFFTDLTRKLDLECTIDFMKISSYVGENSTGKITIKSDILNDIKDKDVIVVEDIMDTGYTISGLYDYLMEKNPKSIKLCVLLDKQERREMYDISPDYVGFTIPNRFVIGYGLDYDEKYRTIPNISCITNDDDKDLEKDVNEIKNQLVKRKNSLH